MKKQKEQEIIDHMEWAVEAWTTGTITTAEYQEMLRKTADELEGLK